MDNPIGLLPTAFKMRESDKSKLSVNWLEYYDEGYEGQIAATIADFRTKTPTAAKGVFGVANVGSMIEKCIEGGAHKAKVIAPTRMKKSGNKSHVTINGLPENDEKIMMSLTNSFTTVVLAKDY